MKEYIYFTKNYITRVNAPGHKNIWDRMFLNLCQKTPTKAQLISLKLVELICVIHCFWVIYNPFSELVSG